MANYNAGVLIAQLRRQQNLTQEKLADGICDRRTLAYIESGATSPSKYVYEKLMERLGADPARFSSYIQSHAEMRLDNVKQEFDLLFKRCDIEKIEALLAELETAEQFRGNPFVRQYCLMMRANIMGGTNDWTGGPFPEILATLDEAVRITVPAFDETEIRGVYSLEEVRIMGLMGAAHVFGGAPARALALFQKLLAVLDTGYIASSERADLYSSLCVTTCKAYRYLGRFDEAYRFAGEAIHRAAETQSYRALPWLIYQKADAAFHLGRREESRRLYGDAIAMLGYYEEEDTEDFVRERARRLFAEKAV